ncbi:MAG: glycosyltransferase family 2 protein [Flavobacteriales bacterium]
MKRVGVAILNWNGEKFLRQFLPGVVAHSRELADIYVIDNASSDGSLALLENEFPEVKVIKLAKNYGFAGGYNKGLTQIPNELFVLLNSDVEVTPNWMEPVLTFMDAHSDMKACQPKILDFHRKEWFEYAGAAGGFIDKDGFAFCAGRMFYAFDKDENQYSQNGEVFWASGASLFIYRDAYFEVDGLDEDFFAHMEEIDLCWRLKNRGYAIGACRESIVYHYGGGTLDRMNPYKTFLNFRNNLFLIMKNHRESSVAWRLIRRMILDGLAGIRFLTEGNFKYLFAVIHAHFSFYYSFPKMYRRRKSLKAQDGQINLKGLYTESIIKAFFIQKIRHFQQLDQRFFVK